MHTTYSTIVTFINKSRTRRSQLFALSLTKKTTMHGVVFVKFSWIFQMHFLYENKKYTAVKCTEYHVILLAFYLTMLKCECLLLIFILYRNGYPFQSISRDVWWYYMFSLAFYWALCVSQFFDVKRKDFWQMFIHHIATIVLMSFSWVCNLTRIGSLVLVTHDSADIFLEVIVCIYWCVYMFYEIFTCMLISSFYQVHFSCVLIKYMWLQPHRRQPKWPSIPVTKKFATPFSPYSPFFG